MIKLIYLEALCFNTYLYGSKINLSYIYLAVKSFISTLLRFYKTTKDDLLVEVGRFGEWM